MVRELNKAYRYFYRSITVDRLDVFVYIQTRYSISPFKQREQGFGMLGQSKAVGAKHCQNLDSNCLLAMGHTDPNMWWVVPKRNRCFDFLPFFCHYLPA